MQTRGLTVLLASLSLMPVSRSMPGPVMSSSGSEPLDTVIPASGSEADSVVRRRRIAGPKTVPDKHPWQVYLQMWITGYEDETETSSCGGSVVSPSHVLTAAHCVTDRCGFKIFKVKAIFGAYDICKKDWTKWQVIPSSNILVHPGYSTQTLNNDVAILVLPKSLKFNERVRRVNLPPEAALVECHLPEYDEEQLKLEREQCSTAFNAEGSGLIEQDYELDAENDDGEEYDEEEDARLASYVEYNYEDYIPSTEYSCASYYDQTWATVAGWGATFKSDTSCELREAESQIYPSSDEVCLNENLQAPAQSEDKICAFNPNWDTDTACKGDSGSALVVRQNGSAPVQVGVVSYGVDAECGKENTAGIYARVQHFTPWIRSIING